jgi:putative tricarboxylic transport membrane protein
MKSSGNNFNKSELVAAGLLIALGMVIVWQAKGWVYLTTDGPGPGFFPMWTGGAIIVLAAVVALRHCYDVLKQLPVEKTNWKGASRVFLAWSGLTISIILLGPLGFVASFLLLVLFFVMVIYRKSLLAALSVGVGAALGFWVLFVVLLQVQLPAGPWGF